jgi:hypothetical protein
MHGQVTFSTPEGAKTFAFEHGVIRSASGGSVAVRAPDSATWTWALTSSTIVTRSGVQVDATALATGQRVVVVGQVTGGVDDARRIFVVS